MYSIEKKVAKKNLKRNKSKYSIVTFLLVICMISFIGTSTYINYEEKAADLVREYDVDAEMYVSDNIDYKSILEKYVEQTGDTVESIEYAVKGLYVISNQDVQSKYTIAGYLQDDPNFKEFEIDGYVTGIYLIGVGNESYKKYINELGASYGSHIVCNTMLLVDSSEETSETTYKYDTAFKNSNLELSVFSITYDFEKESDSAIDGYEIIDDENLMNNFIFTDEMLDGFMEFNSDFYNGAICVFVDMETFNKIDENIKKFEIENNDIYSTWLGTPDETLVKVNCGNIIGFSNYMEDLEEVKNEDIDIEYYSLENQEKLIYLNTIQLILEIVIIAIVLIAIVSTMNILNASLTERKQEFKILNSIGATRANINKILIHENLNMLIKAMIISVIISIPIIYTIIKYMENVIILNKLYIPFGKIILFFVGLIAIFVLITLYSTKYIKTKGRYYK